MSSTLERTCESKTSKPTQVNVGVQTEMSYLQTMRFLANSQRARQAAFEDTFTYDPEIESDSESGSEKCRLEISSEFRHSTASDNFLRHN